MVHARSAGTLFNCLSIYVYVMKYMRIVKGSEEEVDLYLLLLYNLRYNATPQHGNYMIAFAYNDGCHDVDMHPQHSASGSVYYYIIIVVVAGNQS